MHEKETSWEAIVEIAHKYELEPCILHAVVMVESAGTGFLPDGRPKILFEGHIFWRELQKAGLEPVLFANRHPDIVFQKWDRRHYQGGVKEYDRLERARQIHDSAAGNAASWGAFQLMGFNHKACGYATVAEFVNAMNAGFKEQLDAAVTFMANNGMLPYLQNKDWAGFAKRYNGPGYAQNRYDEKLRAVYEKCAAEHK